MLAVQRKEKRRWAFSIRDGTMNIYLFPLAERKLSLLFEHFESGW